MNPAATVAWPGPPCHWRALPDPTAWARQAADAIGQALQADLDRHGRARLLCSANNTALPVYRQLARQRLRWGDVEIGLVDERWATPDSPDSLAARLRDHLLVDQAAAATLAPLVTRRDDPDRVATAASSWLRESDIGISAVVFGMDEDGHTASLLPRAGGLDQALVTPEGYAVIDASGCDGGGRWPTRITLTPAGFALAKARILLLRGASRRRVFELALAGEDAREMPIRAVMHAGDVPLQVFWQP